MKTKVTLLFLIAGANAQAGPKLATKIEAGYLNYRNHTVRVDPGTNWKGYYLSSSGVSLNLISGLSLTRQRVFAGIGLGYTNFKGVSGATVFSNLEYLSFHTKLTPILNIELGYSHLWNQYSGGTGTAIVGAQIGLNYRITKNTSAYIQAGTLVTQQASLIPLTLGLRF